jgi:hypothetical protein
MDHNNITSALRNIKKLCRDGHSEQKLGMLTIGAVLFHDNARPYTAARTRSLLQHFN